MRIRTEGLCSESATMAREHAQGRIPRVLGKALHQVRQLSVRVGDLNGPRGGVDKFCTIDVVLHGGRRLRVRSRHERLDAAVANASLRMRRLIQRTNARRRRSSRRAFCRHEAWPNHRAWPNRRAATSPHPRGDQIGAPRRGPR